MWKERESQKLTQTQGLSYCPKGQVLGPAICSCYIATIERKRSAELLTYISVFWSQLGTTMTHECMSGWCQNCTQYGRNFTWFPLNPAERNAIFMVNSVSVAWRYYFLLILILSSLILEQWFPLKCISDYARSPKMLIPKLPLRNERCIWSDTEICRHSYASIILIWHKDWELSQKYAHAFKGPTSSALSLPERPGCQTGYNILNAI